jgi:hypothetical protein
MLGLALTTLSFASPGNPEADSVQHWRELAPSIKSSLNSRPTSCDPGTMRGGILDAAELEGTSFALIDVCPLGAYTELIDVMRLQGDNPIFAHFRKDAHEMDAGFSRGASAMHGKDIKLVPEKHAVYDISWDNDGLDRAGTVKLQKCDVNAYIWNPSAISFDFDRKLSITATRSYCHELEHQVH